MKIPPNYKITQEIISLISQIETQRNILSSLQIPPDLKEKIQRISLLQSSLFSARIEGNPLKIEEIEHTPNEKKKIEIFNLVKASQYIEKKIKSSQNITKNIILDLHQIVMKDIGVWGIRDEPGAIFDSAGMVVYLPPLPNEISSLLSNLFDYINSQQETFPLVKTLISHLVFEKIHPFIDGNGRVGRLLIFAILKSADFNFSLTVPFEKYLDEHESQYYSHLDNGLTNPEDYLLFMLKAIYEETKNLISQIGNEIGKDKDLYLLPPRQEEIYLIVKDHVFVSFDDLRRRFARVPERTLRYDLKKLQEKNLLVKTGKTKGSFYKIHR